MKQSNGSEKPEHSPQPRELRPKPAGHVWAWIIIAVGSVMFLAIALWVIVAGNVQVAGLSGHEGIHVVSSRWAERWAQAPGPPSVYVDSAEKADHAGDHAEALRYTTMALALDPDQSELARRALSPLIVPDHKMAIADAEQSERWTRSGHGRCRSSPDRVQGLGGLWRGAVPKSDASALLQLQSRAH